MKTNHTPGPWEVGYSSPDNLDKSCLAVWQKEVLDNGFGSVICKVSPESLMNETDKANARLIAAAPTMLEALKAIAPFVHDLQVENFNDLGAGIFENKELTDAHILVFNAITKATGEKEDSNA